MIPWWQWLIATSLLCGFSGCFGWLGYLIYWIDPRARTATPEKIDE